MYVNRFVLHTIALMLLGFVFVLFLDGVGVLWEVWREVNAMSVLEMDVGGGSSL